jgi:hypothetical protein
MGQKKQKNLFLINEPTKNKEAKEIPRAVNIILVVDEKSTLHCERSPENIGLITLAGHIWQNVADQLFEIAPAPIKRGKKNTIIKKTYLSLESSSN